MNILTEAQALDLVHAHLGRAAQDPLEIAVVLEAWGGVAPDLSLPLARAIAPMATAFASSDDRTVVVGSADRSLAMGDVGFVIGVLFVGFWISSLADEFGLVAVDRAWRLALPVSLGAQWLLRRRYLSGPDGLGRLRCEPWIALPGVAVLGALALVRPGGLLAVALTTIWVGGFILTRRGWGPVFGLGLVLGAATLKLGLSPRVIIGSAASMAVVSGVAAVWGSPRSRRRAGPWQRAVPAGLIGAGMGFLLVIEPRFAWHAQGILPALTVVPSLFGSLWGGLHMTRLWEVMPQVLVNTSVRRRSDGRIGRLTSRLLAESMLRLLLGAAIASSAVMAWVVADGQPREITRSLLIAHGVLAVAGLCVALLEAFGRWGYALLATAFGCAVATGLHGVLGHDITPGVRILWGAIACTVASTPPLVALLREPDRNIAAAL